MKNVVRLFVLSIMVFNTLAMMAQDTLKVDTYKEQDQLLAVEKLQQEPAEAVGVDVQPAPLPVDGVQPAKLEHLSLTLAGDDEMKPAKPIQLYEPPHGFDVTRGR